MVRLSVNINKIATLRNARGGNTPDVLKAAVLCQESGAHGITVHPRPDERHIRYADVLAIKPLITTEFNIEGYPSKKFVELVLKVVPDQVTLVPDAEEVLTSNTGWDTVKNNAMLKEFLKEFSDCGIRTSLFVEPDAGMIEGAAAVGTDRIELYTESYAKGYPSDRSKAIKPFMEAAGVADKLGLGINAGHDLNLDNLRFFANGIASLKEVSIGHALISDALYLGLENAVAMYLRELMPA